MPYWFSKQAWRMTGDWHYPSWIGLLANLAIALASILVVCLICEVRFRYFGTKIRLWEFFLFVLIAGIAGGMIGNRIHSNNQIEHLSSTDERYTFTRQSNLSYRWLGRLLGESSAVMFQKYTSGALYWDHTLEDDFWVPLANAKGLESVRISNFHYNTIRVPLPTEFFKAVGTMKSLRSIRLEHCKIEVKHLEYLKRLPNLEEVFLKHSPLDAQALEILGGMKNLDTLSLTGSEISVVAIKELRMRRPDLQITY